MKNKFDEVVSDVLRSIEDLKYEDKDKNIIKANLLLNFFQLAKTEEEFQKNIYVLQKENIHPKGHRMN